MRFNLYPLLLGAFFLITASAFAGVLDGTAWELDVVPTRQTAAKGAKGFDDVLTFSRGRVVSKELKRSGIPAVAYTAHGANGFYNWETAPVLRTQNKAEWGGVINGRNIDGTLKWVTRDGRALYYTIKGRRR